MRWRGVGAMGGVGGGGWGVGVVLVPTVWLGGRSTRELSGARLFALRLNELLALNVLAGLLLSFALSHVTYHLCDITPDGLAALGIWRLKLIRII